MNKVYAYELEQIFEKTFNSEKLMEKIMSGELLFAQRNSYVPGLSYDILDVNNNIIACVVKNRYLYDEKYNGEYSYRLIDTNQNIYYYITEDIVIEISNYETRFLDIEEFLFILTNELEINSLFITDKFGIDNKINSVINELINYYYNK